MSSARNIPRSKQELWQASPVPCWIGTTRWNCENAAVKEAPLQLHQHGPSDKLLQAALLQHPAEAVEWASSAKKFGTCSVCWKFPFKVWALNVPLQSVGPTIYLTIYWPSPALSKIPILARHWKHIGVPCWEQACGKAGVTSKERTKPNNSETGSAGMRKCVARLCNLQVRYHQ